jgi:hypothetical protein
MPSQAHDVADQFAQLAVRGAVGDPGPLGGEVVHGGLADLELQRQAGGEPGPDQVLDHLGLGPDPHAATGELVEVDVLALPVELQVDAAVLDPLGVHPGGQPELTQQLGDVVLEHPGPLAGLDVGTAAVLDDHRVDPGPGEKLAQQQPGGPGADDADLGPGHPRAHAGIRSTGLTTSPA